MERIDSQEDLIKRYLLGELSAAEQTALEDEYFGDEFKYDRLSKAEDELLDRYARGSLSEADRESFERSYLTNPRRRRHVMFAKALARVVDENLTARRAAPQASGSERIERPDTGLSWLSHLGRLPRVPRFALSYNRRAAHQPRRGVVRDRDIATARATCGGAARRRDAAAPRSKRRRGRSPIWKRNTDSSPKNANECRLNCKPQKRNLRSRLAPRLRQSFRALDQSVQGLRQPGASGRWSFHAAPKKRVCELTCPGMSSLAIR